MPRQVACLFVRPFVCLYVCDVVVELSWLEFNVIERGTNRTRVVVYELLSVDSFQFRDIQAVLMLKTTFLSTPLVFDLEFEGHAVGMWVLVI